MYSEFTIDACYIEKALDMIARFNRSEIVKSLSEIGMDAGCVEGAFHNAACINHKEIVELLSKHEVVDTKDSDKVLTSQLNEVSTESVNQSQHIV